METALVVLSLALPIYLVVRWELERLEHPAYLRSHGVVILSEEVLQGHSAPIGEYRGHPIWASVRFKGMDYRFARIVDGRERERIGPRELFVDPGLVYVTE
jgi:hypothetical protein